MKSFAVNSLGNLENFLYDHRNAGVEAAKINSPGRKRDLKCGRHFLNSILVHLFFKFKASSEKLFIVSRIH